jgi:hypothetical protein
VGNADKKRMHETMNAFISRRQTLADRIAGNAPLLGGVLYVRFRRVLQRLAVGSLLALAGLRRLDLRLDEFQYLSTPNKEQ